MYGDKRMRQELAEFLDMSDTFEVRGTRILLEYFFANEKFREFRDSPIKGVSVFGSARIKEEDEVYLETRRLGKLLYEAGYAVVTGASSGVMEAANRGVSDAIINRLRKKTRDKSDDVIRHTAEYKKLILDTSIGLKINLPFEKDVNPYLGTAVSFHYFAIRKLFFAMMSEAFIGCEGGWGTRDEFWEMATLVQTGKSPLMPIISMTKNHESLIKDLENNIEHGYISETDTYLIDMVDTPEQAVHVLNNFYKNIKKIKYSRDWEISIVVKKPVARKNRQMMLNYMKKHPDVFSELLFSSDRVAVRGFSFRSFGHLRRLVNALNGTEEF
jgi:uncharacterized protein (TIGR00730 family)